MLRYDTRICAAAVGRTAEGAIHHGWSRGGGMKSPQKVVAETIYCVVYIPRGEDSCTLFGNILVFLIITY